MALNIFTCGRTLFSQFSLSSIYDKVVPLVGNVITREASKKAGGSSRNKKGKPRPKHRCIKFQDGMFVQKGSLLITQNRLRCLPGLNVGFGKNGTLFAMEAGKVMVSCEKMNPNWDHTWVIRTYGGRMGDTIYKKYFNVIPERQHNRFKLVEEV